MSDNTAADQLASAVEWFLEQCLRDDGDPWSERPTQDLFQDDHPLQEALAAYRKSRDQPVRQWRAAASTDPRDAEALATGLGDLRTWLK